MRLPCGRLEQCRVRSDCLSTKFGSIKIRPVLAFTPSFLPSNNMSATAKSTTPISPATNESKDWTKAATPELQSGSEDEASVLDAKVKERCRCKQVRREERLRQEEAERLAHEEAEHAKAEVERKAREEAEHKAREQVEKERADSQARAESEQRKAVEVAAKQRAVEVAAKQKTMAQEASKKRARDEREGGGNLTTRRREMQEEEDNGKGRCGR